jgi:hypothetical protein
VAVFARRDPPPAASADYRKYRPLVREDFCECCAYCLLHEILAAGADNFELDHFKPKSDARFAALATSYYNIYYSCHVCNHYKGAAWPSEELASVGCRFLDPCVDMFSAHFREDPSGEWVPLSKAAEYTAARLRLNRKHLVEIRSLLRDLALLRRLDPPDWDHPARDQIARLISTSSSDGLSA